MFARKAHGIAWPICSWSWACTASRSVAATLLTAGRGGLATALNADLCTDLDDLIQGHAVSSLVMNGVAVEVGKDGLGNWVDGRFIMHDDSRGQ